MRPETAIFIDNAGKMPERARFMLDVPLYDDAGRAAFHAARALIFERGQRIRKSHQGVQWEFHRLAKGIPGTGPELPPF